MKLPQHSYSQRDLPSLLIKQRKFQVILYTINLSIYFHFIKKQNCKVFKTLGKTIGITTLSKLVSTFTNLIQECDRFGLAWIHCQKKNCFHWSLRLVSSDWLIKVWLIRPITFCNQSESMIGSMRWCVLWLAEKISFYNSCSDWIPSTTRVTVTKLCKDSYDVSQLFSYIQ